MGGSPKRGGLNGGSVIVSRGRVILVAVLALQLVLVVCLMKAPRLIFSSSEEEPAPVAASSSGGGSWLWRRFVISTTAPNCTDATGRVVTEAVKGSDIKCGDRSSRLRMKWIEPPKHVRDEPKRHTAEVASGQLRKVNATTVFRNFRNASNIGRARGSGHLRQRRVQVGRDLPATGDLAIARSETGDPAMARSETRDPAMARSETGDLSMARSEGARETKKSSSLQNRRDFAANIRSSLDRDSHRFRGRTVGYGDRRSGDDNASASIAPVAGSNVSAVIAPAARIRGSNVSDSVERIRGSNVSDSVARIGANVSDSIARIGANVSDSIATTNVSDSDVTRIRASALVFDDEQPEDEEEELPEEEEDPDVARSEVSFGGRRGPLPSFNASRMSNTSLEISPSNTSLAEIVIRNSSLEISPSNTSLAEIATRNTSLAEISTRNSSLEISPSNTSLEISPSNTSLAEILTRNSSLEISPSNTSLEISPSNTSLAEILTRNSSLEISPSNTTLPSNTSLAEILTRNSSLEISTSNASLAEIAIRNSSLEVSTRNTSLAETSMRNTSLEVSTRNASLEISPSNTGVAEISTRNASLAEITTRNASLESIQRNSTSLKEFSAVSRPSQNGTVRNATMDAIASNSSSNATTCSSHGLIYVYTLPKKFNTELVENCSQFNRCLELSNSGLGPALNGSWYGTDQFNGEVIFHKRVLAHPCRTHNPELAKAFYIPYYGGLSNYMINANEGDSLLMNKTAADTKNNLDTELVAWLSRSPYWKRRHGLDHFLFHGLRHNGSHGSGLLRVPEMANVTKLVLERSSYESLEMAIPYPTGFHPRNDSEVVQWQTELRKTRREFLISFAGGKRKEFANDFRGELFQQCKQAKSCAVLDCSQRKCEDDALAATKLFMRSTFCLQPRGDSFTRRSIFDSLIAGCIPVFFWTKSAYLQYKWHFPADYASYSVFIPKKDIRSGVQIVEVLSKIPPAKLQQMQETVLDMIPRLMYAQGLTQFRDAFDTTIDKLMASFELRLHQNASTVIKQARSPVVVPATRSKPAVTARA